MTLREWLPTAGEVAADLAHVPELPAEYDAWTAPWRGYELHFYSLERVRFFNGFAWSRASARAWHLPLGAVAAYALMIPLLRRVRRRVELRAFAQCWNFGLALFSAMGFCACAPVLLTELYRNGFYFTCCAPAPWHATNATAVPVTPSDGKPNHPRVKAPARIICSTLARVITRPGVVVSPMPR